MDEKDREIQELRRQVESLKTEVVNVPDKNVGKIDAEEGEEA